ncbi:sugar-transfer associated ATP-grasp domain-containing protein [Microbacterium sp. C7(2022)]|uniref:sugar-transfer associated ATP-grasp domain-containing protein n=1 Tax=Microbacterium sp. C7(2022) TaxID=2992759 RepID=UPI00237C2FDF|nr:sugar-transfer associated ATP-grasp domain-containing protein [Microbacterium sp. C7(2022)]MDE0545463.1 flagellar biosynthesis protein [Microbacterium sp. C7(2022)]
MSSQGLGLGPRVRYLIGRARRINIASVFERAREASHTHGKWMPAVVVDMLWQAGFRNVGFQDYIDYDFAILTRAERATYMTHPVSNQLSQKYDHPDFRHIFQDKIEFDRVFSEFLRRDWLVVEPDNAEAVREFAERHGTIVTKEPVGQAGTGVHRYHAADVTDWADFHSGLLARGELLIEEVIRQHDDLAAVCPGTVNTTRVTAFFDGERTHILAMAQKFGRGAVSDQMTFGGFYTMLDDRGHSRGPGYDSHENVHRTHPDSGFVIADFQLPMIDEVIAFVDQVARVVPRVQYVGWDIVVTPDGPVLVEGNWGAGVYENKPSVTGIRTGNKPRYRQAIGF